ncbi:MAG TPA: very short patch repair endonuclease [Chitinophagaceae bacterium]|nr:very short patch repair endonuclease [Chitinophagaceae bacterium]
MKIKVPAFSAKNGFSTSERRSAIMKRIKSTQTIPEKLLRKELKNQEYKFSIYSKSLLGNPDIIFKKEKVVVFVDGEFWHGYNWKQKRERIKANRKYWIPKIERNIIRDKKVNKELKKQGWKVIRIWEHQLKKDLEKCVRRVTSHL